MIDSFKSTRRKVYRDGEYYDWGLSGVVLGVCQEILWDKSKIVSYSHHGHILTVF